MKKNYENITESTEDKRESEIIRIQKKRNNFVMLDKGFLEDPRLTFKGKGILAYLLSKPDNWKVIVKDLINHSADGKKAIYAGLRELKACGYYKKVPVRDETNCVISHWESVIYECPNDEQTSQKPPSPKKKSEKTPISPLLTPFVHIQNVKEQNEYIQNGQHSNININNIKPNQTNISIYPSESEIEDKSAETASPPIDTIDKNPIKIYTREEVADKISLNELKDKYSDKQEEVNLLYEITCEVLTVDNPPTPTFRIAKANIPYVNVKNAFKLLEKEHLEYVISCLNKNGNKHKIKGNTKSYLMTSLFNSTRTITYYYNRAFTKPPQEKSKWELAIEQKMARDMM